MPYRMIDLARCRGLLRLSRRQLPSPVAILRDEIITEAEAHSLSGRQCGPFERAIVDSCLIRGLIGSFSKGAQAGFQPRKHVAGVVAAKGRARQSK